jgi:hypothetical protein
MSAKIVAKTKTSPGLARMKSKRCADRILLLTSVMGEFDDL